MAGATGSPTGKSASTSTNVYVATRELLHGVAEWLLSGPQYQRAGTIRLRVTDLGIATADGLVAIEGGELAVRFDEQVRRFPLAGTVASLGLAVGIDAGVPKDLYSDHSPVSPSSLLALDSAAVERVLAWFRRGQKGLLAFHAEAEPVLWPEHFDLGITRSEVNYGISPGDSYHPEPYAYVGPWKLRTGSFWNAPFGAVRPADELVDAAAIAGFFEEGARLAETDPVA